MRLYEHILLGDTLRKRAAAAWLTTTDEGKCGCALGGALLSKNEGELNKAGRRSIETEWPWLENRIKVTAAVAPYLQYAPMWLQVQAAWDGTYTMAISVLFEAVCAGAMTIEQLADQVKEWEDKEDPITEETVQQLDTEDVAVLV